MTDERLAELRTVYPDAELMTEAGQELIYLPRIDIVSGGTIHVRKAVLSLAAHTGYTSRLLLSAPIPNRGQNWTVQSALGGSWHTPSWNNVMPGAPLEMLLQHLGAYR